jgi:hypothetical protein
MNKSIPYIFLVFVLSIFSVITFAETEEEAKARIINEYSVKDKSSQKNQDELEQQIQNTVKDLQGMASDVGAPQASDSQLEAMDFDSKPEDAPAVGDGKIKKSYLSGMMNEMMTKMISEFLKENPFSKMDREEVKSMLVVKTKGLPVGDVFENNPRLVEMLVDWIRHPYALPKLMGIVNKPDKVKIYSGVVVAIFILSFLLNLFNSKGNLFKRIFKKLCIFSGAFIINIATFAFIFQTELKPTFEVVFKHFHL